ncbi:hypothetical protein DBZ45_10430 [Arthrobacter globiformis]|uniref:Uncharacterized protein n=2 Tax=Arthrobacter globiformis TaxID=1665 RepID=A0A328HJP5_ARTGO|nr:hypothetical protein DBZ45_10430 [Arthrobacter globiformis]
MNMQDYAESKAICRDAFGLLLKLHRNVKGMASGMKPDRELADSLTDLQARAEFHLPAPLPEKLRAAVEAMTPVTSAVKAGDFISAQKIVEDGSIKAARVEFLESVQKEFDRLHLHIYKMGASPVTLAWRTVFRRWPEGSRSSGTPLTREADHRQAM